MKNILYKIVFLLSIHVCLISCSLEPELTSSYTEDVLWKSDENVELYINGFYPLEEFYKLKHCSTVVYMVSKA